ncbi:disulfide bond formation protein B [Sedimentitalea todarodis]|uniref:Disulfide bond formation protein B n=1 Tax=Sedimentitalea todarodis TaxID=1631240 RepID=A0ABU3VB81_9RHOB|nr:disulfide bond formation protein B [Sedimentitalea todarodis]MDU9003422.1 disulfide bond formation protein B [Sedimentitalea todarodis]
MTRRTFVLAAATGSLALLAGAFAFQYIGGMAPCKMCLWQRWPHAAAILIGAVALAVPGRLLPLMGGLAALGTAGIGAYHSGVERGWWQGPTTCTSGPTTGLTPQQLLDQIMAAPLVRCDEVPWELFGLSMASWNMIASVFLALLWFAAMRQSR